MLLFTRNLQQQPPLFTNCFAFHRPQAYGSLCRVRVLRPAVEPAPLASEARVLPLGHLLPEFQLYTSVYRQVVRNNILSGRPTNI